MDLKTVAFLTTLAIAWSSQARDLKADLTAMAPAGKTIRLAYVKGGPPQNFNYATGAAVYAVSSDEGVIRKIYPAGTGVADVHAVNMTADGNRVIFYDRGRGVVVVVKFDGTPIRTFSADQLFDYWINPQDQTEWAVLTDGSTVWRRDINATNNPAVKIISSPNPDVLLLRGGCVNGISDDGTKLVVIQLVGSTNSIGLMDTKTAAFTPGEPGCWPMMRSGTPIQFSQNPGGLQHQGPRVHNEDGSIAQYIETSKVMDAFFVKNPSLDASMSECYPEVEHSSDGHRWLRGDRDYLTFTCQRSKINPILWRVSDSKWTCIEDKDSCIFAGDMDGVVGTFLPSGVLLKAGTALPGINRHAGVSGTYSLDGRLLAQAVSGDRLRAGVVISQAVNGTVCRVYR